MRWIRFRYKEKVSFGIVEGEKIIEISGNPFEMYLKTGNCFHQNEIEFLPPVTPKTIYCAGQNYLDHIVKSAKRKGLTPRIPLQPDFNYRAINALIGHKTNIIIPKDAGEPIHYEAELVAVIGKKAKAVSKEEASAYIFGYTIGNDISARYWQKNDRTHWRAKNTDTFKPMGPWIETDVNLDQMKTVVRVNGNLLIEHQTCNFLFDVPACISFMTRYVTLFPGDVIWMGSEGESPNLESGDNIEIEITGIGVLKNTIVVEK